ncbi:circularly permuted type 2 ATP-grasp protein [Oceanospirillum sediminis]|uniref:Circularly permuted type 2 ATP-grasp protein n=1 Tax=Oceanospirillum sediminis TaxID=2760088 RepID=A0A839ITU4_9GAMM|nr:circularly permuted type 2 ATP-grasp protein [Oceanospirillum sediminis]MBB1488873.1 circularly permuted type 2 ATP-grasp protein [Oceanospirillum sediminis]
MEMCFTDYLLHSNPTDEAVGEDGEFARHWQTLINKLSELSRDDLNGRANEAYRLLQEYGMMDQEHQNWQLDPLPMVLSEEDWRFLEQGAIQRQQLLNEVYQDLYGEQKLLKQGLLPANLIRRHKGYLRERVVGEGQAAQPLFISAMDIGRDLSGQFRVLADHCQCPNGIGMLLENRIINRRVMGEAFNECGVRRITRFFRILQETINQQLEGARDPKVVILSPGPEHTSYSEHAYLASYMGYTLVRSADLTVRKGKVWLKTLRGLRLVDVIIRWVQDSDIDSLELPEYSMNGIPGLLQAVRAGNVKVFNPLGAGLVESPALMPYLPGIAEALQGKPLLLDSIQVNWLGEHQDNSEAELLTLTGEKVIPNAAEISSDTLSDDAHYTEADRLPANTLPEDYLNRMPLNLTQAPFWQQGRLVSRPVFLRIFMINSPDGVYVMPGAICQSLPLNDRDNSSDADEQNTDDSSETLNEVVQVKDTWIRSSQPVNELNSQRKRNRYPDLALVEGAVPSRTAENLYWLGRYLERGESTVRLIRQLTEKHSEGAASSDANFIAMTELFALGISGGYLLYPYHCQLSEDDSEVQAQVSQTIIDGLNHQQWPGALVQTLDAFYASACEVRDLLSDDSWRFVDDLKDEINSLKKHRISSTSRVVQARLDRIIGYLMAFNGSTSDSMPNSNGWFMLEIGRRIERAQQLLAMLEYTLGQELPENQQNLVLDETLSSQLSLVTYRRRYRIYQSVESAIELLILDGEYPRSLAYQLKQLQQLSQQLPPKKRPGLLEEHDKALLKAITACQLTDRESLAEADDAGLRSTLSSLIQQINSQLDVFGDMLLLNYFSHTKTARPLAWSQMAQQI